MLRTLYFTAVLFLLSCKTTTYYITRHAEKTVSSMTNDVPLSAEGEKQAQTLKTYLTNKNIKAIYSTNFIRTKATAEPTRQLYGIEIKTYDPSRTAELVGALKKIIDGNVLVVGHSNTVDDIVNGLTGESKMTDLADNEYGDLFIVKRRGSKYSFRKIHLNTSPPGPLSSKAERGGGGRLQHAYHHTFQSSEAL